ncbi:GNAT family N-acetyltransferase [Legionella taurinensis]|uniref:GNAT family N-acetyltransferase n=1 Tax=Legionella taurinensis TaxID=70611 RepID=A0A3A5L3L8_9GAMM|nr:GNAT family N-acetyltransferase [Legionella taurinensis]RJT43341.1 GNAT family N-acetyltransferase [Legionella taurinensis]RJT64149.1 GNAT family N-acetyltransferase [Legionella taurinensis]STY25096.1 Acetyltransferase [Legionella taurinensis]
MSTVNILVDNNPSDESNARLRNGIVDFNAKYLHEKASPFSIFAQNNKNEIIGGATIWEHSDAFYIDILWVEENYREQGVGSRLLNELFNQATIKNVKKIFVDTYEFQAVDFYKKQGFFVIGRLEDYLLGHDRIYLRKNLG